jgi:hypothetical protein
MTSSDSSNADPITAALERLGSLALRDHSMEPVLQAVVELGKQ